jgi:hypothetical protein
MAPIVVRWLLSDGFWVRKETMTGWGYCDIAAYHPVRAELIAIELKLSKFKEVFLQAELNKSFANKSYVGMPFDRAYQLLANYNKYKLFHESGIGIIAVSIDTCKIILEAIPAQEITEKNVEITKRFVRYGNNLPNRS